MIKTKGVFWLNVQDVVKKDHGEERFANILAGMSPEDQAVFANPILPTSWIDYGAVMRLAVKYVGDLEKFRQLSEVSAYNNFTGIYKLFFSLTTPEFFIKQVPLIWSRYFDGGSIKTEWLNPKHARLILTKVEGMPPHHELNITPFLEAGLKLCGAKNVITKHPKCLVRADDCCVFEFCYE